MGHSERHIEVIARALLRHGGSILACRNIAGGYYFLPGGHVEFGEPAATAAQRELQEEAGLKVRARDCLLINEGTFQADGKRHHEINLVFHVEQAGDLWDPDAPPPEIKSRESHIEFEWLDLASLTDLDLRPEPIRAWLVSGGVADSGGPRCTWVSDIS
jgi:8-oxo-dGTP diphosphatase